MPQTMLVTTRRVAANKPQVVDAYIKAIVKPIAYMLDPTNKETVTRAMAVNLRLSNASEADEAYKAVLGVYERLPYPTADGMKRLHGLLTIVNPKLVDAKGGHDRRLLCPQARHLGVRPECCQEALSELLSYHRKEELEAVQNCGGENGQLSSGGGWRWQRCF